VPVLGYFCEKSGFCVQGNVPLIDGESVWAQLKRRFKSTSLNTFDWYGSDQYQHHKSDDEIRTLAKSLQPNATKIMNMEYYFHRPPYIGCALRIFN
jgi:hypothetical protein